MTLTLTLTFDSESSNWRPRADLCCLWHKFRLRDVSREGLKFYPLTFLFSFFVSIHRTQQPRKGGPSNVFRRYNRDLAQTSPNFHRGQQVRNLASFKTSLKFEPPTFENAARYPNSEVQVQCCDDHTMPWWSWVHEPLRKLCQFSPTP